MDDITAGFLIGVSLLIVALLVIVPDVYDRGYCDALNGKVHGNICIEDGVVVHDFKDKE